jgi:peptidoglycan/LPS O-acetylase OafA/YrhL
MSTPAAGTSERGAGSQTAGITPSWIDRGRIPSLDGLRAVAVLMVIFCHWPLSVGPLHAIKWRCGVFGVQLFFVISGFLITTLLLREMTATGRVSLPLFYLRRTLRIVPVYLAYLILVALRQAWGQLHLTGWNWFALLTYTGNFLGTPGNPQLWSLCVEEHFYLVWPLFLAALPLARCRRLALFALVAALGLRCVLRFAFPGHAWPLPNWSFLRMDDIAVGCLLAFIARDPAWRRGLDRLVQSNGWLWLLLATFLVTQVVCAPTVAVHLAGATGRDLLDSLNYSLSGLTLAVFLWAAVTRPGSGLGRLLNHPAAVGVGVVSYSLYLWHQTFLSNHASLLSTFPINLVCMFLTAWLSYTLIEKPFLSLKDRLTSARPAPRSASTDQPVRPARRERKVKQGEPATSAVAP